MASENDLKSSATTTKHIGKPIAKDDQKEEDELDEEGLLKNGYDVILCGTGLTQSILAAALARAGKKILHCDSNDFYGDIDAVLSFDALNEWNLKLKTVLLSVCMMRKLTAK